MFDKRCEAERGVDRKRRRERFVGTWEKAARADEQVRRDPFFIPFNCVSLK